MLDGLSGDDVMTAGRLLAGVDPVAVLAVHPDTPSVSVAVTGHGTLAATVPALTGQFARHGIVARVMVGGFDGYVFDLSDPSSELYAGGHHLVLCLLDPAVVFDEVAVPWTPQDVQRVWERKLRLLSGLVDSFTKRSSSTLVLNTVPLPRSRTAALVDHRSRAELGAVWREANAALLRFGVDRPGVVVLDSDPLLAEGVPAVEPRMDVYAGVHLSPALQAAYAHEVGHLARSVVGRTRKVLVTDLDNTLWGGVVGDDGPEAVEMAHTPVGEAFRAYQQTVRQLAAQGVLIAAVSKNDPGPARAALARPDATLREDDLVRLVTNWHPKHDNLRDLAADLNLGLDGFVFVDDSPYECALIRSELPEVAVVHVGGDPARHVETLLRDGWFDTRELTTEDRSRTARYRAELVRQDFLDSFESLADYLAELGVRVAVGRARGDQLSRISQITLRTNQFNMTGQRMQVADVAALAATPDGLVLTIECSDRFGDNGIVGVVFGRRDGDTLHLDNFLLSCRVFSRGVEQAAISAILRHARESGAVAVTGEYRATAKNGRVATFYSRSGFTRVPGSESVRFLHDLADIIAPPAHVTLTDTL
ncbi:HAD-IIIC family phosphatase [Saccharothrix obliqua]|uniref:HAD-IIIC family phosphatase n=1 Tax=Saccharothrix obliqua TaxID=2861747 RepID=UPI001C5FEDBD|nr:HAD-IIIC family phosphatase [Saccharothrix obliqua]MBW4717862.1 HAD-IIIC family phosphatase [Saccharothrix obliqua]